MRRILWGPLIAALTAGCLLAASLGAYLVVAHPGVAARVRAALPLAGQGGGPSLGSGTVVVRVDAGAAGRPISPLIYGVAGADPEVMRQLGATLDRSGGNPSSTYNWVLGHDWNAGRDWQFRNGNYGTPTGSVADSFVSGSLAAGARPLMTVPTLGWVAKDDRNDSMAVHVPATGGPPVRPGSSAIAGYDPSANRQRTSVPSVARKPGPLQDPPDPAAPAVYQDEWVHHLVDRFGAGPGGVQLFAMDNEPDLWSQTHTDVHPVRMGYQDMLANYREYAAAVKAQEPSALLLGPDVSGWASYYYSDLDRGTDAFATHADSSSHGGQPFLAWWLSQMRGLDGASGQRLVDYLDVHYYPQAQGVYSDRADPATRALRIRSTRSLWDPSYQDESWIGTSVDLIPRLKRWIDAGYPGTRLAITEYSWGGERDASGAVALAEVLGAFGRQGVDLASYWTYPPPASPAGAAFRLYRNYDGRGATFGDLSLPAGASQPAVAAFASRHSKSGELDVVLANESQSGTARVRLDLGAGRSAVGTPYCVRAGSGDIVQRPPVPAGGSIALGPLDLCLVRMAPS
jgi:Glycoside hydrolase family 44